MKVSVRVSKYVSPIEDCYLLRYDAILFLTDCNDDLIQMAASGSRYVTLKDYEGKEFNKKDFAAQIRKAIAEGYTKTTKLPKLDSSDEYIEINV